MPHLPWFGGSGPAPPPPITPPPTTVGRQPNQTVTVTRATVLNSQQVSAVAEMPEGVIRGVQVLFQGAGGVPHGRIFVQVVLLKGTTISATETTHTLWQGYAHTGGSPSSTPNIRVSRGQSVVFLATQSSRGVVRDIRINVVVDTNANAQEGGGFLFHEQAGDGVPEVVNLDLGDPGANAEYATLTVPSREMWRVVGYRGSFVTDGTAAARAIRLIYLDASAQIMARANSRTQAASMTVDHAGFVGAGTSFLDTDQSIFSLPDFRIRNPMQVQFSVANQQAGDNQGPGELGVEVWAVP